jgi:hypothetical protein
MADLKAVRDAIADRFSEIPNLTGLKKVPGEITPPAALVVLETINYDTTMQRGSDEYVFIGLVLVSKTAEKAGQDALFEYMSGAGVKSVKAKFEEDPTLGGLVYDANVSEVRPPGDTQIGAVAYYGAPFVILVSARGL